MLKATPVKQVNLSCTEGDIGVLADHVPVVAQLRPGVVDVIADTAEHTQKYFVPAGFAIVNKDSSLNISATEACLLDEIDLDAVKRATEDATRRSATGSEVEKATARIELEVYAAIEAARK